MQLLDGLRDDSEIATLARDLTAASKKLGELLQDLLELCKHSLRVAVPTPRGKTGGRERLRKADTNRVM